MTPVAGACSGAGWGWRSESPLIAEWVYWRLVGLPTQVAPLVRTGCGTVTATRGDPGGLSPPGDEHRGDGGIVRCPHAESRVGQGQARWFDRAVVVVGGDRGVRVARWRAPLLLRAQ